MVLVTGSYGKTTTTRAVRIVLGLPLDYWTQLNGNCRAEIGWSVWRERPFRRHAAVEVGIGAPDQMEHYAHALQPQLVVMTCLGREHLDKFRDLHHLRDEKANAVRALDSKGIAVLNWDDENVRWMASQTRAKVVKFGSTPDCDVQRLSSEWNWPHGMKVCVRIKGTEYTFNTQLAGEPMVNPLVAALTVALAEGRSIPSAIAAIETLPPTKSRLEIIPLASGAFVLRDEYKASPDTVHAALDVLSEVPAHRRWIVLGGLKLLPGGPESTHYEAVARHAVRSADHVILVGAAWQNYRYAFDLIHQPNCTVYWAEGVADTLEILHDGIRPDDVVLVKCDDNQRLARVILALLGRHISCTTPHCDLHRQFCDNCTFL